MSRSEEESVEGVWEAVSTVLKEADPEPFLISSILEFKNLNPKGHPSSCINHQMWKQKPKPKPKSDKYGAVNKTLKNIQKQQTLGKKFT